MEFLWCADDTFSFGYRHSYSASLSFNDNNIEGHIRIIFRSYYAYGGLLLHYPFKMLPLYTISSSLTASSFLTTISVCAIITLVHPLHGFL